ncbi:MAG: hypothetical protein ACPGNR_04860 [Paracoccaceae bacterium]
MQVAKTGSEGSKPRRQASEVMKLARMGAFHQNRLSFMRVLLRRATTEKWIFERPLFDINSQGVGRAVYSADTGKKRYSLVAFANDLPPERRSDRVIATEWDASFALFDGIPTQSDLDRLEKNVPLQEAGRVTKKELSISRANRSVRLWDYVVDSLAAGDQPKVNLVENIGYLMRTTAVYGSGKFGAADRETLVQRPEFQGSFQVEMLTVYLIRTFVMDLVEHMAHAKAPQTAVKLKPTLRRKFGIGNSTGLGMAPFLIKHPMLLNNWIAAKEEALSRVRSVESVAPEDFQKFKSLLPRALQNINNWQSEHPIQKEKLAILKQDFEMISSKVASLDQNTSFLWEMLHCWAEKALSLEGQELLISLMFEPYGYMIDDLSGCMSADEFKGFRIDGSMTIGSLNQVLETIYDWALKIDWSSKSANARAWYVSEEKLEPRLGERFEEDIADYEQPLQPGRDAAALHTALKGWSGHEKIATFLLAHPEHRHTVRRCQIVSKFEYAEIRDNTIDAKMLPIDLLRAKLAFFGAGHFDPRSDRWVRINMFKGAPFPNELHTEAADDWAYPALEP